MQFVVKAFGLCKLQGQPVDFSVPSRMPTDKESAQGLLRESDPDMDIDEALARRNFTMNPMAWDPDTLELHDPFNGLADLDAHLLCHTSDHFREDPLLCPLRGMKLAARFGLIAAPETVALCKTVTQDGQPSERLLEEWKKLLLQVVEPSLGLQFLSDCG